MLFRSGQSPLYRSLLQARNDFEGEGEDTNRSVVVITDGENYQYAGSDPALKAPQPATAAEVQAAYSGRKTPIYIMGFGVTSADNPNVEREFRELADSTGGGYFPVQNGRDLLKALRSRLGMGTYSVVDAKGQVVSRPARGDTAVRLNVPVDIAELGTSAKPFTVRFESAQEPIELEGGEAIVLQASADGRDLTALPYDQGLPVADILTSAGRKERYTVRAHRPTLEGRTARFKISLQDEDLRLTRRPAETWIEIKPILADAGVRSVPALASALASFDCEVLERVRAASHTIYIGRVVGVRARQSGRPLLYESGNYASLRALRSTVK